MEDVVSGDGNGRLHAGEPRRVQCEHDFLDHLVGVVRELGVDEDAVARGAEGGIPADDALSSVYLMVRVGRVVEEGEPLLVGTVHVHDPIIGSQRFLRPGAVEFVGFAADVDEPSVRSFMGVLIPDLRFVVEPGQGVVVDVQRVDIHVLLVLTLGVHGEDDHGIACGPAVGFAPGEVTQ